jgi:hypothetical protein
MSPFKNTRLAWSVAIASLALWATSVPLTWGQLSSDATRVLDVTPTTFDDMQQTDTSATPCPAVPAAAVAGVPPAIASLLPTPLPPAPAAAQSATGSGTTSQGSFHLCGPDASAAQAIEQLIAGRSFSASLNTTSDGCADLSIQATSPVGNGNATSRLSVSLGSGQNLQIQITSQNGATHVSIGTGS